VAGRNRKLESYPGSLAGKALTPEKRDHILNALGVGKQSALYNRVKEQGGATLNSKHPKYGKFITSPKDGIDQGIILNL
jgi:hypothetical protein